MVEGLGFRGQELGFVVKNLEFQVVTVIGFLLRV
jgi:hypothetical protein